MPKLKNHRHELFAQSIAKGMIATEAYKAAGYKRDRGNSSRLYKEPIIRARVDELVGRAAEAAEVEAQHVIDELARIGFSDVRKLFDERGLLKAPADWDDASAAAIASLEVVTTGKGEGAVEHVAKIKLWDKNSGLDKLAKVLSLYAPERKHHTVTMGELTEEDRELLEAFKQKQKGG